MVVFRRILKQVILGLAVVGLAVAIKAGIRKYKSMNQEDGRLREVAGTDILTEELRLGAFKPVKGRPWLVAELGKEGEGYASDSDSYKHILRNLLFFNTETKSTRWLKKGNNRSIRSYYFLTDPVGSVSRREPDSNQNNPEGKAIALLYEVAYKNKELPPENEHRRIISIAKEDGSTSINLVDDTDEFLGFHQVDLETLLVFHQIKGVAKVIDFDLSTWMIRTHTDLALAEK